jgi:GNAT superfamily N-acetyltransferase
VRSRYRDQMRADIARYVPGDQQAVLAFRRAMYGPQSIFADTAYFDWLYSDPQRVPPDQTALWLYRKAAQVEAHQGGVHVALKAGLHQHNALWLLDLMVSPRFRLRGLGVLLAEVACEEAHVGLGLEVSESARKALLRVGWSDLGTVPLYIHPLDLSAVVQQRWESRLKRFVGRTGNVALRAVEDLGWAAAALDGLSMNEVTQFDGRADVIWERASPAYPVLCRRDQHYLNWRFARFPDPERYRRFLFMRGDEPVGYAVLRIGEHHGLRAGFLVDFLCPPRWTYALVARCLRFFRRQRVQIVYCLHHNPVAGAAFTALGFVRRPSMWPLMVHGRNLPPDAQALLRDGRNWFITAGDSDADRPREGTVFAAGGWDAAH